MPLVRFEIIRLRGKSSKCIFSVEMVPSIKVALNGTTTVAPALNESLAVTGTTYDWSESQKQLIIGSFFWGYIMTELPGGRLAELIGGHRVFGHSSKLIFDSLRQFR